MKKILLLLLILFSIKNVEASSTHFYYDNERVYEMVITVVKDSGLQSFSPYLLKRKSDNAYVYCIEPLIALDHNSTYSVFEEATNVFKLSDEEIERIELLAYFGYGYPGHDDIKWYGITQYLIWSTADPEADVYFSDERFGKRITPYDKEIKEIEDLIESYKKLLELDGNKFTFYEVEEYQELLNSNVFLKEITLASNQNVDIPKNKYAFDIGLYYYHNVSQNVYLIGDLNGISIETEIRTNLTIRKWYGSGTYMLEEGAEFEIYQDGELIKTVVTDEYGNASFSLPHGVYTIIQTKGLEGYLYVDEFEWEVGLSDTNILMELYDEADLVAMPDTNKETKSGMLLLNIISLLGILYVK